MSNLYPTERDLEIGKALRTLRGSVTQNELQRRVFYENNKALLGSHDAVSMVEKGRRSLSIPEAEAICRVLNVSMGAILGLGHEEMSDYEKGYRDAMAKVAAVIPGRFDDRQSHHHPSAAL